MAAIFDARYPASLADAWSAIETLRLGREYLRGDVPEARPFSCTLRPDAACDEADGALPLAVAGH